MLLCFLCLVLDVRVKELRVLAVKMRVNIIITSESEALHPAAHATAGTCGHQTDTSVVTLRHTDTLPSDTTFATYHHSALSITNKIHNTLYCTNNNPRSAQPQLNKISGKRSNTLSLFPDNRYKIKVDQLKMIRISDIFDWMRK